MLAHYVKSAEVAQELQSPGGQPKIETAPMISRGLDT